jgi:hypothetical protein
MQVKECDPEYPATASSLDPDFLDPDGVNLCGVQILAACF